jgi:2-amino-4-hydroxy-6-hydroxymethyldihydropteridine diphosphokinase
MGWRGALFIACSLTFLIVATVEWLLMLRFYLGMRLLMTGRPTPFWLTMNMVWFPLFDAAEFLALSVWWWHKWRSRYTTFRRAALRECLACGYDLRASKVNCSECGTVIRRYFGTPGGTSFQEVFRVLARRKLPNPKRLAMAYIALGANLGDREKNLREALRWIDETPRVRLLNVSSFLDNPSVGGPQDAPPYLNAAVEIETSLEPHALMRRLLKIEKAMGRVRSERNAPRPIDLDLLLYGDQVIDTPDLVLPHPRMHERRFVLEPLAELAGEVIHPTARIPIAELLRKISI